MPKKSAATTKKEFHVLTVRIPITDWQHLQKIRAQREKEQKRKVSYTEIFLVDAVRSQP